MTGTDWQIPASTLSLLSKIPESSSAVVMLRHSVRDKLAPDDVGYSLPITDAGENLATQLGVVMGYRPRNPRVGNLGGHVRFCPWPPIDLNQSSDYYRLS